MVRLSSWNWRTLAANVHKTGQGFFFIFKKADDAVI
jgi:hypothetical protein